MCIRDSIYLIKAFLTFSSHSWGGCMSFASSCIGINHPDWSTHRYIWNWLSIKLPLLWLILLGIQILNWIRNFKSISTTLKSPWTLVFAQATLIPLMAVLRQSNLYDADRHLLFIYPSLAIFATGGLQSIYGLSIYSRIRTISLSVITFLCLILLIDCISLNPYPVSYTHLTLPTILRV